MGQILTVATDPLFESKLRKVEANNRLDIKALMWLETSTLNFKVLPFIANLYIGLAHMLQLEHAPVPYMQYVTHSTYHSAQLWILIAFLHHAQSIWPKATSSMDPCGSTVQAAWTAAQTSRYPKTPHSVTLSLDWSLLIMPPKFKLPLASKIYARSSAWF